MSIFDWFKRKQPAPVPEVGMRANPVELTNNGPANTPASALRCFSRLHRMRIARAKEVDAVSPDYQRIVDFDAGIDIYRAKLVAAGYTLPDEDNAEAWAEINAHYGVT